MKMSHSPKHWPVKTIWLPSGDQSAFRGNHIGHHSTLGDNCFVSSHVVISGYCNIGRNCFLGVNSAISNNTNIAEDCWIGPGVVIEGGTTQGEIYRLANTEPMKVSAYRFFRISE